MKDLLRNVSTSTTSSSLPAFKESGLKISFKEAIEHSNRYHHGNKPPLPFAESQLILANVSSWRELTESEIKKAYEVTFTLNCSNLHFHPGDTIGIVPQNNSAEVDVILQHLGLLVKADLAYEITLDSNLKGSKVPAHVPVESSLRHVFTHCLDLRGVIKKIFLLALSKFTTNDEERKVLEYLCSKEGSPKYNSIMLEQNFSILDLFRTLPSCKPPVEILLSHLPRLLPRPYSIINSQLKDKNLIKICFSVINAGNDKRGITTGYLEDILLSGSSIETCLENLSISKNNDRKISIYLRKNINGFLMPDSETPLVLIGPGTGVAPFIGFLEERTILKKLRADLLLADTWLFFGCRHPDKDHIYKKELDGYIADGILSKLSTAFSRIDNGGVKYVQDAILKEGAELVKFILKGASIFVCGDLKTMGVQVRDSLKQCFVLHGGMSESEAEDFIREMEREKRYLVDIWS